LADSTALLQRLAPVLRDCASRINLETHGDVTTFELLRMIEAVGDDVLGVCLDTANVPLHGEHPVAAAHRVAPFTHLLHCKDLILSFADEGLRRQTLPPGRGLIDWPALVGELVRYSPDICLTIEDHKWIFDAAIYTPQWRESQRDVTRDEVLDVVAMAWEGERRIRAGLLPSPEEAEKVPYGEQMEERLKSGVEHFRRLFL
jgi:sugar phosphate isomerase/epimerase